MLDGISATGERVKQRNVDEIDSKLYRYSWRFYIPKVDT
jgi:hypothetical protein